MSSALEKRASTRRGESLRRDVLPHVLPITWGAAIVLLLATSAAFGAPLTEDIAYKLKAANLYKFTLFVTWPPGKLSDAQSPIIIGVVGSDPFNGALQEIANDITRKRKLLEKHKDARTVAPRAISVLRSNRLEEMTKCHLLFVPSAETAATAPLLPRLLAQHVLTVTDDPDKSLPGAIINFLIRNDEVHFEINADARSASGLTISSKLRALAIKR